MANAIRPLGRRPSDPDRLRRMIRLRLTGIVPPHPAAADHLSTVPLWMLGGNDQFGTCGPTSIANYLVLLYWGLTGEQITVTDNDVFDLYRRSGNPNFNPVTGADDNGVDMTVMQDALLKGGITITHADGSRELVKPLCYAAVDTDIDTQRAVTSFAGGVIWGADMQVAQQNQAVWDYVAGSGLWGGHAIVGGKYSTPASAKAEDEDVISWQETIGTTDNWVAHQLPESYLPIFPILWAHPDFQAGVDQAQLAADYEAVTGRPFPVPVPPPPTGPAPPPPTPPPGPPAPPPNPPAPPNWALIAVIAGIAIVVGVVLYFALKGA